MKDKFSNAFRVQNQLQSVEGELRSLLKSEGLGMPDVRGEAREGRAAGECRSGLPAAPSHSGTLACLQVLSVSFVSSSSFFFFNSSFPVFSLGL